LAFSGGGSGAGAGAILFASAQLFVIASIKNSASSRDNTTVTNRW